MNEEARTEQFLMAGILRGPEPVTTPEEIEGRYAQVLTEEVKDMLVVQAGKDLGFQPELLERQVDYVLEQHRERIGREGVARYLRIRSFSSAEYRDEARREVYATAWERYVIGREPGPTGRFSRDSFVRPGQLWFAYEQNRAALSEPTTVRVQQLIVSAASVGSIDAAHRLIEDLRGQIVDDGADFGELAEIYGQTEPGTRGISNWLPLEDLCARFAVLCEDFLDDARPGQVSEILPYLRGEERIGFIVLKLLDRREGQTAAFTDPAPAGAAARPDRGAARSVPHGPGSERAAGGVLRLAAGGLPGADGLSRALIGTPRRRNRARPVDILGPR